MVKLNVLTYFPHQDSGHLGGAQVRTIEVIKRGKKHDINYIVVENKPSFCVFPAYITSKITTIPWTSLLQSVPVYWYIADELDSQSVNVNNQVKYTSKFIDIYKYLKIHKYYGDNVLFSVITRWLMYRMLRSTEVLTVRSLVDNLRKVDERIKTKEIDPGYGVDYERIFCIPESKEKVYDAIFAAVLFPEKGIFDVIDAWSIVVEGRPSSRLCIVGRGSEETVEEIKTKIKGLNLEDNIFFPYNPLKGAALDELWVLMKKSKILIHPSVLDSWSLVIGEALACGLPVITYDIAPIRYAYGKCSTVFRVPVKDIKGIAEKSLEIIGNEYMLGEYNHQALESVKCYDWDDVVISERKAYENILNRRI
jgi:glycosyltransferase involved in cell wall biosynthesis